jgi:putative tricarboxylic transport membrane protein
MFLVGFSYILNPLTLLMILLGVVIGIIFGAIPGLTGTMAVALVLPITFSMTAVNSFALLMGIYIGACSGGLISAILLRIPGTASSIATTFDGHPMALRGEAGKALGIGIVSSFLGGFFSFGILFYLAPILAEYAVKFGPYEYFAITFFALTLISSVSGDYPMKGLLSGFIGMSLAIVGISPMDGFPRFTFGVMELANGLALLPALVGLFAVSELIKVVKEKEKDEKIIANYSIKGFGFKLSDIKDQKWNFVRSALIGTGIGILPGLGGSTANLLAYLTAKKSSKYSEKFGTGIVDGIVASETANNAAVGGALVPLLTLGIPGDTLTAMLIGAFMVHGLTPGPLLFTHSGNVVYSIFASLIVANIMMLIIEYGGMRGFVKLLSIPKYILLPTIMVLCVVGAIGLNNRVFDAWTVLIFGIVGYALSSFDFPLTPVILGFILGPMVELYLRRGLQMSQGRLYIFLSSPIAALFIIIALVTVTISFIQSFRQKKKS